jgi:hypothetical protein
MLLLFGFAAAKTVRLKTLLLNACIPLLALYAFLLTILLQYALFSATS